MSNKTIIGISVVLLLSVMALFFYIQKNRKPALEWSETYEEKSENKKKNPYDVSLLRSCLSGNDFKTIDLDKKISEALPKNVENTNYVFIGEAVKGDSADWKALLEYVKKGNTVFWASKFFPKKFLKQIKKSEEEILAELPEEKNNDQEEEMINNETDSLNEESAIVDNASQSYFFESLTKPHYDSIVNVQLFTPDSFHYQSGYYDYFGDTKNPCLWAVFENIDEQNFKYPTHQIGSVDSLNNCFSMNCEKGRIIFHSNPILFTNVELVEKDAKTYSASLFSLLKKGDIYWDNHNRTKESYARYADLHEGDNPNNENRKTPLQYVLSNLSLSWAWYSLLGMGLLFLIFSAKRRQRTVPVLAENTNTSLAFIQSIGRLYFNKQEHTSLCRTQYKQWQWFVRQRYGLKTNNLDAEFAKKLALSSGLKQDIVQHIIDAGYYIDTYEVGESNLIQFHKELESFYKQCK
jgi:hypothetical protein